MENVNVTVLLPSFRFNDANSSDIGEIALTIFFESLGFTIFLSFSVSILLSETFSTSELLLSVTAVTTFSESSGLTIFLSFSVSILLSGTFSTSELLLSVTVGGVGILDPDLLKLKGQRLQFPPVVAMSFDGSPARDFSNCSTRIVYFGSNMIAAPKATIPTMIGAAASHGN